MFDKENGSAGCDFALVLELPGSHEGWHFSTVRSQIMSELKGKKSYWFPAKSFGWGWGLPSVWQGWVVLFAFLLGITALPFIVDPSTHLGSFLAVAAVLAAFLLVICYTKGEPPKWRWGQSSRD